jgi:rhodanese-related sulfurtransferase
LEKPFATYLGWVIPWGTPLTLLADTSTEITEAQRQLVRIGIDRPAAAAIGEPQDLVEAGDLGAYAVARFEELQRADQPLVLDVRRDDERRAGHLKSSIHIPLQSLETRMGELPHEPLWVHCASAFRASIAASLLARAGFEVVLIDDDWPNAKKAGLNVETESSR